MNEIAISNWCFVSPMITPRTTPDKVTSNSRFSRIHWVVSAVTLRGPCEAETSWPPILAKRYSENLEEDLSDLSSISSPTALAEVEDPEDPGSPSLGLSRRTAGPRQNHGDEGLPFWGWCCKSARRDQSRPPTRCRRSLTAFHDPIDSIVVPAYRSHFRTQHTGPSSPKFKFQTSFIQSLLNSAPRINPPFLPLSLVFKLLKNSIFPSHSELYFGLIFYRYGFSLYGWSSIFPRLQTGRSTSPVRVSLRRVSYPWNSPKMYLLLLFYFFLVLDFLYIFFSMYCDAWGFRQGCSLQWNSLVWLCK